MRTFCFLSMKKALISLFIILNMVAVLYSNRPAFIDTIPNKIIEGYFSKTASYNTRYILWLLAEKIRMYAYLAGLGNHWTMFGFQNHFNWWYVIKAKYADGHVVLLPLPRQSKRTFWQWLLFDLKEAKFHWNISSETHAREKYAKYLCKQFKKDKNSQISSIKWKVYWQYIKEPKEAIKTKSYLYPKIDSSLLHNFKCSKTESIEP